MQFFVRFFLTGVMFLGGAWLGLVLVNQLEGNLLLGFVGFAMLPLAFFVSLIVFGGLNFGRRVGRSVRKRSLAAGDEIVDAAGSFAVVPTCAIVTLLCGAIIGLLSDLSIGAGMMRFGAVGLGYGVVLWLLLRNDLLELPD